MPHLTPLDSKASRLTHSLHSTNKVIAHVNRLVSSTCHLDALLGVVSYTLSLLLLLLRFFRRQRKKDTAHPFSLLFSFFFFFSFLRRGVNISRLVELINTMRTFLRVSTGLVRIMSSASSSLLLLLPPPPPPPPSPFGANNNSPPNDKTTKAERKRRRRRRSGVISVVARSGAEVAQMALLSVYQIYENIGFLTDQGILSSSSSSSSSGSGEDDTTTTASVVVKNYYLTSSRAWMGSVVFSILSTLLATTSTSTCENTMEKEKEKGWWWWKKLVVPIGINLPLSAHASFEKGLLGDEVVALMGLVVSGLCLRQGWRDTEEEEGEEEEKIEGKEE